MTLSLKTPPASLADLMLQSVCDHLRHVAALDASPQVAPVDLEHIRALSAAAVDLMDGPIGKTRRALLAQTWTYTLDWWPERIVLPLAPVLSVSSVKYYDTAGYKQTLGASKYNTTGLASLDPTISLASGETWPEIDSRLGAIEVEFIAGYGDGLTDVPAPILQAIRMLVAHWYEQREAVLTGSIATDIPLGVAYLLQPYRIFR